VGKENIESQTSFVRISKRKLKLFERGQEEAKGRARKRESIYFCCRIR